MSTYKVVLLGGGTNLVANRVARVGKTSLIERYVNGTFSEHRKKTVNASFLTKSVPLDRDSDFSSSVSLNIWVQQSLITH